ncbi:2271_t:CDS:2, partial [Ambispora gerdemannii]
MNNHNIFQLIKYLLIFYFRSSARTNLQSLTIPYIQNLRGNIEIQSNPVLTNISCPYLKNATNIVVNNNHDLQSVQFPSLIAASSFNLNNSPLLGSLFFPARLTHVNNIEVTNTGIRNLDGVDEIAIKSLTLENNANLRQANFPALRKVNAVNVSGNRAKTFLFLAQNLVEIGQATIRNTASMDFAHLTKVSSNMKLEHNNFESLSIPNLETIGGTLNIASNNQLRSISLPKLNELGSLVITENPHITKIDGFQNLERVHKIIDITGNYSIVSFPLLKNVDGGFNSQSRSADFDCNSLNALREGNIVDEKKFYCQSGVYNPKPRPEFIQDILEKEPSSNFAKTKVDDLSDDRDKSNSASINTLANIAAKELNASEILLCCS